MFSRLTGGLTFDVCAAVLVSDCELSPSSSVSAFSSMPQRASVGIETLPISHNTFNSLALSLLHPSLHYIFPRHLDRWISGVENANGRARELKRVRDLSERKVADDHLARSRADQHVHRVKIFHQRKLDILEQEALDNRMDMIEPMNFHCGDERHLDVHVARDACQKLLEHLLSLRRRKVKAMQNELLRREQLETFEIHYRKLESNLREAQRGEQHTHVGRDITADVPGKVTEHVQPGAYQSVLKERREFWSLAVGYVQRLKLTICRTEMELQTMLRRMREHIPTLRNEVGRVCYENERILRLKAGFETKNTNMRIRAELLEREQSIFIRHNGEFFDTDVWQEGVMQRIPSGGFRKQIQVGRHRHIQVEY